MRLWHALKGKNLKEWHRPLCHVQGYLAHKKPRTPQGYHRALDIDLLWGARGGVGEVLTTEVPLYRTATCTSLSRTEAIEDDTRIQTPGFSLLTASTSIRKLGASHVKGYLAHQKRPTPLGPP